MGFRPYARFSTGARWNPFRWLRLHFGRSGVSATVLDGKGRSVFNTRTRKATARLGKWSISRKLK